MWITNSGDIIKSPKQIEVGGITYPRQVFMDKELLTTLGIKPYREVKVDDRYYWQGTLTKVDNGTEVVGTYEAIPRDIEALKEVMKSDLKSTFANKRLRPQVEVTIGLDTFFVDGSRDDILNFEDGKLLGVTQIKDADGNFHAVTSADYDTIISAQKANGLALYNTKWTKEQEIDALATLDAIKLYEATPYVYTYTQADVDEATYIDELGNTVLPLFVVGETEDRLRNNVKEW